MTSNVFYPVYLVLGKYVAHIIIGYKIISISCVFCRGSYVLEFSTEIYTLATDSWALASPLPGPSTRSYSFVAVESVLTAFASDADTVYEYDEAADAWLLMGGVVTGPAAGVSFDSSVTWIDNKYIACTSA